MAGPLPGDGPDGTSGGFQATACLPMRVEDRDLGALVFSFRTPRAFSADERAYLQAVTALCAQALDRARLLVAEREAREAAERQLDRMTFLARAGRLLEAPLSVEQRLRRFADLAVPAVADWCAVHLVRDDHVEQVAVAHSDPEKLAFVARLQERYPPDPDAPSGAIHVSRTGEPSFLPEVPDELIVASAVDDEHLALARSIGIRSVLIVPLLVRGAASVRSRSCTPSPDGASTSSISPSPSSWPATRVRPGQRAALRAAAGHRRDAAGRTRCPRPCPTYRDWGWPPATGRSPTRAPGSRSGATSTTSSPRRNPAAGPSSWPTSAARARRPRP